jgi:integrase
MATINGYRFPGVKGPYRDRHGKLHCYLRASGAVLPIPAEVGLRKFKAAYMLAITGHEAGQPVERKARPETSRIGTVEKAVRAYIDSTTFAGLAPETQTSRGGQLRAWAKNDGGKVGRAPIATLRTEDLKRGLQDRSAKPKSANNWLIAVRMLLEYCVDAGGYGIKKNPAADVKRLPVENTGGWPDWKEADLPLFERKYPKGTPQYLGREICLALGQRRSDVVRFGWHMVTADNMIEFTQQKTGAKMRIPLSTSLLEVLPPRTNIVGIDGKPDETPFLLTVTGKRFTPKRFTEWMHEAWVAAGCPQHSTHGARKLAARRLRKAGCPPELIMAFTGHSTEKQLRVYLGAVEREEMADELRSWVG